MLKPLSQIQVVSKRFISFHKLISKRIPVQIFFHFDGMFLEDLIWMFNVFILADIEIPFIGREKAFCVMEYARSQKNKTVQHAFVREFSKQSPTAMQIWTWLKKFKEDGCLCRRKGSGRPKSSEERVMHVGEKILQSPKKSLRRTSLSNQIPPATI